MFIDIVAHVRSFWKVWYAPYMGMLVLIRHGQSQWNLENRFTGWSDVPLTERGRADAAVAAKILASYHFNRAFTSRLQRSTETLQIVLKTLGQAKIPVLEDSALNERHYGDLQGLNKTETAKKYGEEKVQQWRRSYTTRPPNGESIEDCGKRVLPFFREYVLPCVKRGETVLVVASGNSMRPILKELDYLDSDATATMEIGLCTPYIYTFDGDKMVKKEVIEVPGIVTKGASIIETTVREGRI